MGTGSHGCSQGQHVKLLSATTARATNPSYGCDLPMNTESLLQRRDSRTLALPEMEKGTTREGAWFSNEAFTFHHVRCSHGELCPGHGVVRAYPIKQHRESLS